MKTAIGMFKGSPTISLDSDSKWPFTFGVAKAQKILECLPEIQAFVKRYGAPVANADPMGVDRAYEDQCQRATGA